MRDRDLEQQALAAGLLIHWRDAFGKARRVAPDTLRALLDANAAAIPLTTIPPLLVTDAAQPAFVLPAALQRRAHRAYIRLEYGGQLDCDANSDASGTIHLDVHLPPGYHCIEIGGATTTLAAAPSRCFTPADAFGNARARAWGIAAQVYGLRAEHDLGVGNFGAIGQFARAVAAHGAAALALSPLHAMFAADAARSSPYSPSHRGFLNILHADPLDLVGANELARIVHAVRLGAAIAALRRAALIDWPRVAAVHRRVFEQLFELFRQTSLGSAADFSAFRRAGGNALAQHACFEALDGQRHARGDARPLAAIAADADSHAALAFARSDAERVTFHVFLQWCAARGLAAAQIAARTHGMSIGLISDLAVGVDPAGSECWSRPRDMLMGATIGAPPDELNALGQDWGLTTFAPGTLVHNGYAPFLEVLRAAMRHAGGVRIDHVMSLLRLWLVPRGARALDGAYLRYPLQDLLRLIALESWRHRCIVIGEDLGTVPPEIRATLAHAGVLGMDVLAFTRNARGFVPASRWRSAAVAMTSTHDLPPLAGWWQARDLDWRRRLSLYGERDEPTERTARETARHQLLRATGLPARARAARVVDAAIAFVARTPAPLALVPLEDLLGAVEQPNLPGTTSVHPNWRRRYPSGAQRLLTRSAVRARLRTLQRLRSGRR